MDWYWPDVGGRPRPARLPPDRPRATRPQIRRGGRAACWPAERPVIYAGGGILKARAAEALRELAERTGIPVVTTLMARGAFPDSHPLCLGMPGMHGNYTAVTAMQRADLLIALGSRFDDRVTGKVDAFAPEAKVIHVDIDPAELGKVRRPTSASPATAVWSSTSCWRPWTRPAWHSGRASVRRAPPAADRPDLGAVVGAGPPVAGGLPAPLRGGRRRWSDQAADRGGDAARPLPGGHHRGVGGGPAPDVGLAVLALRPPLHLGQLRRGGHHGLRRARPPSGPRWAGPTGRCGPSTATAASR